VRRLSSVLGFSLALGIGVCGCASGISQAIVTTRNHQGDLALVNRNYADAAVAYRLALRISPSDEHARAGLAEVQLKIADQLYQNSTFDEALAALAIAAKYDPQSVRLAALRSEIDDARIKREIVVSNFPAYRDSELGIRRAYVQLRTQSAAVVAALRRFDYTYDAAQLSKAIRASYELNSEVGRLTQRLINYRQLVESGSPEKTAETPASSSAASLLPLP